MNALKSQKQKTEKRRNTNFSKVLQKPVKCNTKSGGTKGLLQQELHIRLRL